MPAWKRPSRPCAWERSITSPSRASWPQIEAVLCKVLDQRDLKHKNLALQNRVEAAEGPSVLVGDVRADGRRPSHDRHGGADRCHGADPGRDRHRQGTGRTHALAAKQAVPTCRSCRSTAGPLPSTWSRASCSATQGSVHRRRPRPQGAVRGRQRRHAVPGRGGRAEQEHPGEAAAFPGIGRDPPRRREQAVPHRRARAVRHQPRPADDDPGGPVPRGPVLPHQHVRDPPAGFARDGVRTSRTWPGTCWRGRPAGRWSRSARC